MPLSFTIKANARGTILPGVVLRPQDRWEIRWTAGAWTANPTGGVPPQWYDANGNPNVKAKGGYLLYGVNEGGLIACIGNPATQDAKFFAGNYAIIGDGRHAGQLWVAINDDWDGSFGAGYADNQGEITIQVTQIAEREQPTTKPLVPAETAAVTPR